MTPFSNDEAAAALREAERTIINAKWHLMEEHALTRLVAIRGLACTPLFPNSTVIQVVAYNGQLLGRARLHGTGKEARWVAVEATTAREIGTYRHLSGAARALARAADRPRLRVKQCTGLSGTPTSPAKRTTLHRRSPA